MHMTCRLFTIPSVHILASTAVWAAVVQSLLPHGRSEQNKQGALPVAGGLLQPRLAGQC
jgi:hypothetical protein